MKEMSKMIPERLPSASELEIAADGIN